MGKKIGEATELVVGDFAFEAKLEKQSELTPKEKRDLLLKSYIKQGMQDVRAGASREENFEDEEIMMAYNKGYDFELAKQKKQKTEVVCEVSGAILEVNVLRRA